jgi:hypothetical protein
MSAALEWLGCRLSLRCSTDGRIEGSHTFPVLNMWLATGPGRSRSVALDG